jgi:hypothetical protein
MKTRDGKRRYWHVKYRCDGEQYSDNRDFATRAEADAAVKQLREQKLHAWHDCFEKDRAGNVRQVEQ